MVGISVCWLLRIPPPHPGRDSPPENKREKLKTKTMTFQTVRNNLYLSREKNLQQIKQLGANALGTEKLELLQVQEFRL